MLAVSCEERLSVRQCTLLKTVLKHHRSQNIMIFMLVFFSAGELALKALANS